MHVRPVCFSLLPLVAAIACNTASKARVVGAESQAIDVAIARPSFTLTSTDGKPYDFAVRTAGRLTFLEFGYTHCPDVCPVHMANLAAVVSKLEPSDRMKIDVVFVSIDPDRDSLPVLRKWLDAFDPSFIGLTGSRQALDDAQRAVGFGPAVVQLTGDGTATVTHAAPVVVFTADDSAHVMFPFGTRQADWTRDIPHLLAVRGLRPSASTTAPTVGITRAYIVVPVGAAPAALYLDARNFGDMADTLVAVDAGPLGPVSLHESMDHGGSMTMVPVPGIAVAAGGHTRLAPGGFHGMIGPPTRPLTRGERIPLTFRFAHGGELHVEARVITYADVDTATAPSPN